MHGQLHQPVGRRHDIHATGIDGVTVARIARVYFARPHDDRRHLEPDRAQPLDHLLRQLHRDGVQHDHVGERHQGEPQLPRRRGYGHDVAARCRELVAETARAAIAMDQKHGPLRHRAL